MSRPSTYLFYSVAFLSLAEVYRLVDIIFKTEGHGHFATSSDRIDRRYTKHNLFDKFIFQIHCHSLVFKRSLIVYQYRICYFTQST